jgi:hypothetical protein
MGQFKIGDVVRLKGDTERDINVIVRAIQDGYMLCVSNCGERWVRVWRGGHELVNRPDPQADLKQAIREVMLSKDLLEPLTAAFSAISVQAIAKAVADELRGSWADRMVEPASTPKPAPWTPKVGDWVKVTKPVDCAPANKIWWVKAMDRFHGQVLQVTSVWAQNSSAKLDDLLAWEFDFAWLAPAEDPRGQPAPKRYREPTLEDLKNGPIECEVRNHNTELWMAGKLLRIHMGFGFSSQFECRVGRMQKYWHQCRIEVK